MSCSVAQNAGLPQREQRSRWASYKWLTRWRRRWSMPKGWFAHQDMPPVAEMKANARTGSSSINTRSPNRSVSASFDVPWPLEKKTTLASPSAENRGRKTVPFRGPPDRGGICCQDRFPAPFCKGSEASAACCRKMTVAPRHRRSGSGSLGQLRSCPQGKRRSG